MTEAEVHQEEDDLELVHWFDRPPMAASAGEMAALLATAFTAGALAAVGLLAITGRLRD